MSAYSFFRRAIRALSQNSVWLVVIGLLIAFILLQHRRRMAPLRPPIAVISWPAYANVMVNLKSGTVVEILADLSEQSRVPIVTRFIPSEAESASKKRLNVQQYPCTLHEAIETVFAATELNLKIEYERDRVMVANGDQLFTNARATTVIYPVGDLLLLDDPLTQATSRSQRLGDISDLIKAIVQPDAWIESGGTLGRIRSDADKLIIFATPGMHWQIEQLLQALRAQ